MSCVRPGVLLTRASFRVPVIALIALDLPEFERPTKATSGSSGRRKPLGSEALVRNLAAAILGSCGKRRCVAAYPSRLAVASASPQRSGLLVYNPRLTPTKAPGKFPRAWTR